MRNQTTYFRMAFNFKKKSEKSSDYTIVYLTICQIFIQ